MLKNQIKIAFYGNPVVQAYNLSNIIEENANSIYNSISLMRGVVHKLNFTKEDKAPEFKLLFNLDKYGNQTHLIEYINRIIEDYLNYHTDNFTADEFNAEEVLLSIIADDFLGVNTYAKRYLNTFKNIKVCKEDMTRFIIDERIDLKLVYLNQHMDNNFVKLYNAMFLSIKFYIIKSIQNEIEIGYDVTSDAKNNCIELTGKMSKSVSDTYEDLLRLVTDNDLISKLLTLVEITIPNSKSDLSYVLSNTPIDSAQSMEILNSVDYAIYCETKDRYQKDINRVEREIELLSNISPSTRTKYILVDGNNLPDEVKGLEQLADSLSDSNNVPSLKTIIGDCEIGWYDDSAETVEQDGNTTVQTMPMESADKIIENTFFERKEIVDTHSECGKINIEAINRELNRVGIDGFTESKVIAFGETPNVRRINNLKVATNNGDYFGNYEFIELDTNKGNINIYVIPDFKVNSDLESVLIEEISKEYDYIKSVVSGTISDEFTVLNTSVIDNTLTKTKNLVSERVHQLNEKEISNFIIELITADLSKDTFNYLLQSFLGEKINYKINDELNLEVVKANLTLKMLMSLYTDILVECSKSWKNCNTTNKNQNIIEMNQNTAISLTNDIFNI